jgi:hypothetical protein
MLQLFAPTRWAPNADQALGAMASEPCRIVSDALSFSARQQCMRLPTKVWLDETAELLMHRPDCTLKRNEKSLGACYYLSRWYDSEHSDPYHSLICRLFRPYPSLRLNLEPPTTVRLCVMSWISDYWVVSIMWCFSPLGSTRKSVDRNTCGFFGDPGVDLGKLTWQSRQLPRPYLLYSPPDCR